MFQRLGYLVLLASAGVAAPAAAQGFQVDAHAGVDVIRADDFKSTGAIYGLTLAYDLRAGGALLGAQLDLDASSNKDCATGVLVAGDRACAEAKRDTALSVRLGVPVSAGSSVYVLAGYANSRFDAEYTVGGNSTDESRDLDGLRLGLGAQTSFGGRWFGKAEYRYTNFEDGVVRHGGLLGIGVRF